MHQPVQGQKQSVSCTIRTTCVHTSGCRLVISASAAYLIGTDRCYGPAQLSQPTKELVFMCNNGWCGLFGVTPNNPYLVHPNPGFGVCQHLLWLNLTPPTSRLALMHSCVCCGLAQPSLPHIQLLHMLTDAVTLSSLAHPSSGSPVHQWKIKVSRRMPTVLLSGMLPPLDLVPAMGYCDQALHDLRSVLTLVS